MPRDLKGYHIEQLFMIEVFAGGAVLTSVAKHFGLGGIAIDKIRKSNARCTIYQLDLLQQADRELLEEWLSSPLLLWVHFAPVCGTASRAREIPQPGVANLPRPLRSLDFPLGLPDLTGEELKRVELANALFLYTCLLFAQCIRRNVLATMENPRGSYFWLTPYVLDLQRIYPLYATDFQACMYGSLRDKWTRVVASFPEITSLDMACDRKHKHLGWGFTLNAAGQKVWATAEESQYPRKLCIALVQLVLQVAHSWGVTLKPNCLQDISDHPLLTAKQSQVAAGLQPKTSKLPPIVPDFQQSAVFLAEGPAAIPCSLMARLPHDLSLRTEEHQPALVPKGSRFLRGHFVSGDDNGGSEEPPQNKRRLEDGTAHDKDAWAYKVVFGLPWSCEQFIERACKSGHPAAQNHAVPLDLRVAIQKHLEWSEHALVEYRMQWCREWLKRAKELEDAERRDAATRPAHVQATTSNKRLLLTQEMLDSVGYEDDRVLDLLREGSPLAGEIPSSPMFKECYKPCLLTLPQLLREAPKRNQAILASSKSCGDRDVDAQLLAETKEEVRLGWARGPLSSLPEGSVVSRRFPLVQGSKTRMIDDYSISGINDTASTNNKVDLHMIDTFAATIREYFRQCDEAGVDSRLVAKTYDLKAAYRQVPIKEDHLRFSFFSIYNCERDCAEIYQLVTLPFGATHSVYSFLRLSRALHTLAARALYLINTNFYDDYILASKPGSVDSARHSMELIFLLTGWQYATEGKKCSSFDRVCRALGVEFDLTKSGEKTLAIRNTEQRVQDLQALLTATIEGGTLGKQEALVLRGKLGFADSFLHGRLGALLLKQLSEHAYGRAVKITGELKLSLRMMLQRLQSGRPRTINALALQQWFVYTDAAYEPETCTGGLGGALFNSCGECIAWFGIQLSPAVCREFGSDLKHTIIYELELCASVLALDFWADRMRDGLQTCFGDNDAVRFSLIRGNCASHVATKLMEHHLRREADCNLCVWFARVPTEANVSDYPSRGASHPLLPECCDESAAAKLCLERIQEALQLVHAD